MRICVVGAGAIHAAIGDKVLVEEILLPIQFLNREFGLRLPLHFQIARVVNNLREQPDGLIPAHFDPLVLTPPEAPSPPEPAEVEEETPELATEPMMPPPATRFIRRPFLSGIAVALALGALTTGALQFARRAPATAAIFRLSCWISIISRGSTIRMAISRETLCYRNWRRYCREA